MCVCVCGVCGVCVNMCVCVWCVRERERETECGGWGENCSSAHPSFRRAPIAAVRPHGVCSNHKARSDTGPPPPRRHLAIFWAGEIAAACGPREHTWLH